MPRATYFRWLAPAAALGAVCAALLDAENPSIVFPIFYDALYLYGGLASSGLLFVGSRAHSLELLGSKSRFRNLWATNIGQRRRVILATDFPYIKA